MARTVSRVRRGDAKVRGEGAWAGRKLPVWWDQRDAALRLKPKRGGGGGGVPRQQQACVKGQKAHKQGGREGASLLWASGEEQGGRQSRKQPVLS